MKSLVILPLSVSAVLLAGLCVVFALSSPESLGKSSPELLAKSSTDEMKKTPELGKVRWIRDLGEIQSISRKENKPIFMLFQEVPG